jgi:hypothetical protein
LIAKLREALESQKAVSFTYDAQLRILSLDTEK